MERLVLICDISVGQSYFIDFVHFVFFNLAEEVVVPIAFGYLLGERDELLQLLLFGLLFVLLQTDRQVEGVVLTHLQLYF